MCRCSSASSPHAANAPALPDRVVLPREAIPSRYELTIRPDLVKSTFSASVSIHLTARLAANTITLNAVDLDGFCASLLRSNGSASTIPLSYHEDTVAQTVAFSYDGPSFAPGEKLVLNIAYNGVIGDNMVGFYRSNYSVNGVQKFMAVTQFEAVDCRRAVPSFDEPELKAVFNVAIIAKADLICLSNTDVVSALPLTEDPSYVVHRFGDTPLMSTYLLAFAVGELDYIEKFTVASAHLPVPVRCRVYTPVGDSAKGEFALEVCVKTLELFSERFGIPYPLSKCDQIAVPDFSAGAMENWGLITYRTVYLLVDKETGSVQTKMNIAATITHELAHQWFGNLVTFKWWDELWLNEGFATWVGTYGAAYLFSEWDLWSLFVSEDMHFALSADGVRTSHPIYVPVRDGSEIAQIFDSISYSKGASVINMLTNWLSLEVFFAGLRVYLKKHSYDNANTGDLWNALSAASGKNVSEFMNNWVMKIGYPVVSVVQTRDPRSNTTSIALTQHRFLSSADVAESEDSTIWTIPLDLVPVLTSKDYRSASASASASASTSSFHTRLPKTDSKATLVDCEMQKSSSSLATLVADDQSSSCLSFDSRESKIDVSGNAEHYFVNGNRTGFYRVAYDDSTFEQITNALTNDAVSIPLTTRMGVYSDAFALARGGVTSITNFLALLKLAMHRESAYSLFVDVIGAFNTVQKVWAQEPAHVRALLDNLALEAFAPQALRLGLKPIPNEPVLDATIRPLVAKIAAMSNHKELLGGVLQIFKDYVEKNVQFSADMFKCVFAVAVAHGGEYEFNKVTGIFEAATTTDERYAALSALGQTRDSALISRLLAYSVMTDKVRPQDIHYVWGSLSTNPNARRLLFDFLVANWALLSDRYKSNFDMLGSCVAYSTNSFTTQKDLDMIMEFFASHDMSKCTRKVNDSISTIKVNIAWLSRDRKLVTEWLQSNLATTKQ